ncbi:SGNH/GDSL hydrolase family protein [Mahella sp.]|uniref:SGNH/GDSL hydrolase family protein n=1 Tax=Mahella sp. TaxID=2798721 RepID=UPI0025BCF7FC|nr:SGNH/GDSL hydrolase family protein [Mahella sp.]MBZ4665438.1 lipolytic protein family [Mahella sp.]MDK2902188.1 acyl-CoA thioesterase [Clostridiales bacterium]
MLIEDNAVVLFQGDSVTDAGRDYNNDADLGMGYPMITAAWLSAAHPAKHIRFINKGISGNRVKDLKERWTRDCIALKPTWVSILIGINDCWRRYDSDDPTSVERFESDYRYILQQVKTQLNANLIICEPFVLPVPEDRAKWREDLDPKIHAVRRLAREFDAIFVPLDGIFAQAAAQREPSFWLPDGVHPSPAGHALIAQSWLRAVEAL